MVKKRVVFSSGAGRLFNTRLAHSKMPWCMHRDIGFCCCPPPAHMVFGLNATYYPTCKLLRVENQLFCMRPTRIGRHALQMLVHAANSSFFCAPLHTSYKRVFLGFQYSVTLPVGGTFVEIPSRFTYAVGYLHNEVLLVVHVRRAQRAIRRYLRRKWEERALAVMMASHARLGAGSALEGLQADVLAMILLSK